MSNREKPSFFKNSVFRDKPIAETIGLITYNEGVNPMEAIRILTTVKNNEIALTLPILFENKEVEVIVLPLDSIVNIGSAKKDEFLRFLKDGPTLSDEELHRIDDVKKEFRHWTFDEY